MLFGKLRSGFFDGRRCVSGLLCRIATTALALAALWQTSLHQATAGEVDKETKMRVRSSLGKLPLYFIENRGQLDSRVAYYVQGRDKQIYFTSEGVTFVLNRNSPESSGVSFRRASLVTGSEETGSAERWILKLKFVGANPAVTPKAEAATPAVISYFKGPESEWKTGLKTYDKVIYADLWPGIDLVYSGTINRLKYHFVVRPGADPKQIKLAYQGSTSIRIDDNGELEVSTPLGGFHDDKPYAYQEMEGKRVEVAMAYDLEKDAARGENRWGFLLGPYDRSKTLVLDPAVLVYAGYIGGSGTDRGFGIAVDSAGNAYITGETNSSEATFPETAGPDLLYNGGVDAFVAKVNPEGTAIIYAGYIGGSGDDRGFGIAVDGSGNAYITGETNSSEATFPKVVGPDLIFNGGIDAFAAKVNAAGTGLTYAGYIGGSGDDRGFAIAVDGAGNAYIAGETNSAGTSFPDGDGFGTLTTFDGTKSTGVDAFVAKVKADGTALSYAGYIGGAGTDRGFGIAVDGAGNAYVTGETSSDQTTFPVTVGPDLIFNGVAGTTFDAFVAKVNSAGTALSYAGYIGGAGDDRGFGIAIRPGCVVNCEAYVTGETNSDKTSFPDGDPNANDDFGGVASFNDIKSGLVDAFVAKVNAGGTALDFAGYIGGALDDRGFGIAVDAFGGVYVTGETASTEATFPNGTGFVSLPTLATFDGTLNGGIDAFVAKVAADGLSLELAGYIGGSGTDRGFGIAVDKFVSSADEVGIYVAGETNSGATTFPDGDGFGTLTSFDKTLNGGIDAFVAKLAKISPDLSITKTASPKVVIVGTGVTYTITVTNSGGDATGVTVTDTLPASVTFVSADIVDPPLGLCVSTALPTVTCALGTMTAGDTASIEIVVTTIAAGAISNTASVDAIEDDSDPTNNTARVVSSASLPDLIIKSIVAPLSVTRGSAFSITETTRNRGTVLAGPSVTKMYLSRDLVLNVLADTLLTSRTVQTLHALGESSRAFTITIPRGTPTGKYYIIAVADADGDLPETSELNNKKVKAITVK